MNCKDAKKNIKKIPASWFNFAVKNIRYYTAIVFSGVKVDIVSRTK